MFLFTNFRNAIVDIKNYFQLLMVINKNKNSYEWKSLNLRVDWIGRIYTCINLRQEDFASTEEVRRLRINKQLAIPIYTYLTERLNLVEILKTRLKYIEDSYSYLLYFVPDFTTFSLFYVMKFFIFLYLLYSILNIFNIDFWFDKFMHFLSINNILK